MKYLKLKEGRSSKSKMMFLRRFTSLRKKKSDETDSSFGNNFKIRNDKDSK